MASAGFALNNDGGGPIKAGQIGAVLQGGGDAAAHQRAIDQDQRKAAAEGFNALLAGAPGQAAQQRMAPGEMPAAAQVLGSSPMIAGQNVPQMQGFNLNNPALFGRDNVVDMSSMNDKPLASGAYSQDMENLLFRSMGEPAELAKADGIRKLGTGDMFGYPEQQSLRYLNIRLTRQRQNNLLSFL